MCVRGREGSVWLSAASRRTGVRSPLLLKSWRKKTFTPRLVLIWELDINRLLLAAICSSLLSVLEVPLLFVTCTKSHTFLPPSLLTL